MKKVEVYKLSNGELFEGSESQARAAQKKLDFKSSLWKFADKCGLYSEGKQDLYDVIQENADELENILKSRK